MGSFVYFEDFEDHINEARKSIALDSLDKWLDGKIKHLNDLLEKQKVKPYGEERRLLEAHRSSYCEVKSKIKLLYEEIKKD